MKKILQPIYALYVMLTFATSILLAFPFFLLISIGNNIAARKAIYTIIKFWCKCWMWVLGMPVKISGPEPPPGRYVVVANHISYLDTLIIFPAIPSYFRALGKKEISKIPVVGFIYRQVVIMVDRSSQKSRSKSMKLMWRVLKHEANIIIFPEGTFNETKEPLIDFYDGAFRLAVNTQTAILPMILVDTVDRWNFTAWWKLWPGKNRVVYMEPIQVAGLTLNELPNLKQRVYDLMDAELRKYRHYE